MRKILIVNNELEGDRYAIPFQNEWDARTKVGHIVLEQAAIAIKRVKGSANVQVQDFNDGSWLIDSADGQTWVRIFIQEEGLEGVWLGFDSGSRDNYTGTLPNTGGDGWGSSDAYLFRTAGMMSGRRVEVSETK